MPTIVDTVHLIYVGYVLRPVRPIKCFWLGILDLLVSNSAGSNIKGADEIA